MQFFTVTDKSCGGPSYPRVTGITRGLHYRAACPACRCEPAYFDPEIEVQLDPQKGCKWPDVLRCAALPLLILSNRVLEAWAREKFGILPVRQVTITGELPSRLRGQEPLKYFAVDGAQLVGAELDAVAARYVGVQRCTACGAVSHDYIATCRRQ
jgi:hypothetical protein